MSVITCPYCDARRDARTRITGDITYCPSCGGWYRIEHQAGGVTVAHPHQAPDATLPPRRRPRGRRRTR